MTTPTPPTYDTTAERNRLIARLEMERDAVFHAIRSCARVRIPERLWQHGRELTRQLQALQNPGRYIVYPRESWK